MGVQYIPPIKNKAEQISVRDDKNNYKNKNLEGILDEVATQIQIEKARISNIDDNNKTNTMTYSSSKIEDKFDAVNAQFQTVEQQFGYINIKYPPKPLIGAKGDGVTDDTQVFENILANYNNVFVPEGTYIINKTLYVNKKSQRLKGNGFHNTIIKAGSSFIGSVLLEMNGSTSSAYRSNQLLEDIQLFGLATINGLKTNLNADFLVNNIKIKNCLNGVYITDSLIYEFNNCTIDNNDCALYFDGKTTLSPSNNSIFRNCRIFGNKVAVDQKKNIQCMSNVIFDGCEIEGNGINELSRDTIYMYANNNVGNNLVATFRNCWIESNKNPNTFNFDTTNNYDLFVIDSCISISSPNSQDRMYYVKGNGRIHISNVSENSIYKIATLETTGNVRVLALGFFYQKIIISNKNESVIYSSTQSRFETDLRMNESKLLFRSAGGTGYNHIWSTEDNLSLEATMGNMMLNCKTGSYWGNMYCTWEKPFRIGQIYIWAFGEDLYTKSGSKPTTSTDGKKFTLI